MTENMCAKCVHRYVCKMYEPWTEKHDCKRYRPTPKARHSEADEWFESILICAERYACGRQTYMPSIVVGYITDLIPELSNKALTVIRNDITAAQEHGSLGDKTIDEPLWKELRKAIVAELKRREEEKEMQ